MLEEDWGSWIWVCSRKLHSDLEEGFPGEACGPRRGAHLCTHCSSQHGQVPTTGTEPGQAAAAGGKRDHVSGTTRGGCRAGPTFVVGPHKLPVPAPVTRGRGGSLGLGAGWAEPDEAVGRKQTSVWLPKPFTSALEPFQLSHLSIFYSKCNLWFPLSSYAVGHLKRCNRWLCVAIPLFPHCQEWLFS